MPMCLIRIQTPNNLANFDFGNIEGRNSFYKIQDTRYKNFISDKKNIP